ncbi:two-component sensor histidine kinase [Micromonospora sp. C51]|uniref:sensor histidine kinase n=1 Tax=Micromonospora sp. C51 TaxID=2824879 RepID=UPI001B39CB50|nr:histidine kinase [Micromonospora sp. C51]MBQ1051285.1 two-component sensor histidine kinase [Micromonospora sp. C51]
MTAVQSRWRSRPNPGGSFKRWRDLLLWALLAAPFGYVGATPPYSRDAVVSLLIGLGGIGVAVAVSRRLPLVALIVVVLGTLLNGNFVFAIPVFSYLAGRRSPRTLPVAVVFALIAAGGTVFNLGLLGTGMATWFMLATVLLFAGVFPWLIGRYRRQQAALADAGRRYEQARAHERQGEAERIRLRERARIAREMHDSLGHSLSLIALRAAALELADGLDLRHRVAAGELRASVAEATERLHGIIGVLREETAPVTTRPAGEDLADLVDGAREAGMAVRLNLRDMSSNPHDVLPGLPELTWHAAYGLVREALTNAARYAPGAEVTVSLVRRVDGVVVEVVNESPPAGPLPGPPATGSGLLALAERVRLAGGSLSAGACPQGGFAVRARLPVSAPATNADAAIASRPDGTDLPDVADQPDVASTGAGAAVAGHPVGAAARRQVRRSLLVALGAPVGLALALSLIYYPVASVGAVLDRSTFEDLRVGAARGDLVGLPPRQVDRPAGARPDCEYYTDGNFPFAHPTWRLCFADGRLVSKEQTTE